MTKTTPPITNDEHHDTTVVIPLSSSHNNNEIEESSISTVTTKIAVVHGGGSYLDSQNIFQNHNASQSFVQKQQQVSASHSALANDHLTEVDTVPIGTVDDMDDKDYNDELYIQQQKTSSSRIDDVIDVDLILLESAMLCQHSKPRNVGRGRIAVVTDTDHELGRTMIRKIASFPFIDIVLAVSKHSKAAHHYNHSLFFNNINNNIDNRKKLILLYADITTECGRREVVQKVDMLCKDPQSNFHRRQLRYQ